MPSFTLVFLAKQSKENQLKPAMYFVFQLGKRLVNGKQEENTQLKSNNDIIFLHDLFTNNFIQWSKQNKVKDISIFTDFHFSRQLEKLP